MAYYISHHGDTISTSHNLLDARIIKLVHSINIDAIESMIGDVTYLLGQDEKKPIHIYIINNNGGDVTAGMAIADLWASLPCPVYTYCFGHAYSMGALLLTFGEPGHRYCARNARIMIHQISTGAIGKRSEVEISIKEAKNLEAAVLKQFCERTGKTVKQVTKDTNEDYYMSAEQAKSYGIIDTIL